MSRVLLVDITNVYVAAHAKLGHLKRSDGYSTGGLYNTVRMVEAMKREAKADRVYLCFEDSGVVERLKINPEYKQDRDRSRPLWHEDHQEQLQRWALASGYILAYVAGGEADDAIATITIEEAGKKGNHVTIMSKDHDFRRLLGYGEVYIRARSSDQPYGFYDFQVEHGFPANRYFDYLCLAGDASDNVRGHFKPTDARAIIEQFPTWEDALASEPCTSIAGELAMNRALMAWKLGPLCVEEPIERDEEQLRAWYQEMEMSSMLKAMETA